LFLFHDNCQQLLSDQRLAHPPTLSNRTLGAREIERGIMARGPYFNDNWPIHSITESILLACRLASFLIRPELSLAPRPPINCHYSHESRPQLPLISN